MRLRAVALSAEAGAAAATPREPGRLRARPTLAKEAVALLSLPLLVTLLYAGATRLWWLSDDFFNLRFVRDWRPAQYCLDPAVWQRLPFRMLTPLLFVSYDVDLALFGWDPFGFYVHQLVALALAGIALYLLLRRYLPIGWALAGAALFLAGVPLAAALATQIMVRHYPESVLLALLATLTLVTSLRARRPAVGWLLAGASAGLWLAAALAKEIAVPLLCLLPLLPEADLATRLRRLTPHLFALLAYLAYRRYLMGAWIGGYGWAIEGKDWIRLSLLLPARIARELAGRSSPAGWIALAIALATCLTLAWHNRRRGLLLAVGGAVALAPLLPVATEVVPRYAVAAWLLLVIGFVFAASSLPRGRWLVVAASLALLVANRQAWATQLAVAERQSVENQALLSLGSGDLLRSPAGPPASLEELKLFGREVAGRDGGGWFADDVYLCLDHPLQRLWEYDAGSDRVVEATGRLPALRQACGAQRNDVPLTAVFRFDGDGVLHWELGPYDDGRWSFVLHDGVEAFAVPPRGAFRLGTTGTIALRVRYDAAEGWTTYSPVQALDLSHSGRWSWRR